MRVSARPAFTLFELMVAVTIIAMLLAMLLPVLGVVREQADATRCLGNLRQCGLASGAFSADHQGYLVPADGWHYTDDTKFWNQRLAEYLEERTDEQNRWGNRFRKDGVAWGCPSWTRTRVQLDRALQADYWYYLLKDRMCGYAMTASWPQPGTNQTLENSWWFVDNNHYYPADQSSTARWNSITQPGFEAYQLLVRAAQITNPANSPLVVDGYLQFAHGWYQAYGSAAGRKMVIERHRGKGSCVFVDGHAKPITGEQWATAFWTPWNFSE